MGLLVFELIVDLSDAFWGRLGTRLEIALVGGLASRRAYMLVFFIGKGAALS